MFLPNSRLIGEIFRFGTVGFCGYLVDSGVLLIATKTLGLNPYSGRAISLLVSATMTFFLNRRFTFRSARPEPVGQQWIRFVSANAIGVVANVAAYSWMLSSVPFARTNLPAAVAVGSLAGMGLNFTLSRWLIFRDDVR